ncbi:armadillo-type protein [Endogone sp. FLAS-F59071]|nr:armadillo-type protein [Endogone sp. FLAS-F59071]|eukprot:RUS19023.1 armadillo-type protein [Endogone sp. FLAS-F59071]
MSQSKLFYKATTNTISTLTFILPEVAIPMFLELVRSDLGAKQMVGIGALEVGIWKSPEGQLFVDVLKRSQKNVVEDRNRKSYAEEKWEREVREQIAKKKGTDASKQQKLTKDEQATVDAQTAKEAGIRKQVQEVYGRLIRGLQITRAMINGSKKALEERLVELVRILLAVAEKGAGVLVEENIVDTYLELGKCASERIDSIREPLGLATLRGLKIHPIPQRWEEELLDHLVTRVLFRLRFITEHQPLGPASFSYCFPILNQVIVEGGIGCNKDTPQDKESAMEQVVIALDIVGFHASQGKSSLLPRQEMITSLLMIVKEYPKLSKTAKTILVTLCEAIDETATPGETEALLAGLLSGEPLVRVAALQGLEVSPCFIASNMFLDMTDIDFSPELWIACHDEDEVNVKLATQMWEENGMDVEEIYKDALLKLVVHHTASVRVSAGKAIASAVQSYPDTIVDTLESIYITYKELARPLLPEYDEFGMVISSSLNRKDPWESRVGLALALKELAPYIRPSELPRFIEFLIKDEALGDRNEDVRHKMLDGGLAVISTHGKVNVAQLLPVFKGYLDTPATNNETHDRIRESVVILFGSVAGYLDEGDPKIRDAVDKLIETLKTPSEAVQSAVGECLPPLIKMVKDDAPKLVESLLNMLFKSEKYAERRGAAYGLAGIVKGRGISTLKDCNIMAALKEATENKKVYQYRQGALFAYETLSATLGRLFEPYVIQIVPLLLVCFGDSVPDVREATSEASRVIMSKISGHCVKLIMPSLLAGLDDRQWRTKKGSVELLGSMAFCAPKQLSISLPTIVPRLTDVLTDSHAQVTAAANQSLLLFGEVINNPEIQELVPILLNALSDPNTKTKAALTALLETAFVHYIDAPSLALVMPILERGLRERNTEIKTKSSQIVGNMSSLTDQKDLIPYLPRLMPGLKEVLVDPVPEARATAAKALGGMIEKLGEENFPSIVDELVLTLKSDTGGVDRQGAAQGLSEVLAGLGLERLEGLLPEIISNADSPKAYVREGFISLLIYLPATFGVRFQPYLGRIIPPILMGLADESEYVRDASLRAGRMIVINYATKAVDLLLPELEKGLFDDNWRIRHSSVQLMGDLLFRITGTSLKSTIELNDPMGSIADDAAEVEEEETGATEANRKALLEVLGKERRDRVLAALYIVRQDIIWLGSLALILANIPSRQSVSGIVRQASLVVWKAIVANTPRVLKEILPVMMVMVIRNVASSSCDRRTVAARTLGDLVRKLGERILSEIIPMLEDGLESSEANTRQGVSIALSEIMATAGRVQVNDYVDSIIPAVRKALCDSSRDVREAAAQGLDTFPSFPFLSFPFLFFSASRANIREIFHLISPFLSFFLLFPYPFAAFDVLHQNVGPKAIDEILPTLLNSLQSTDDTSIYALGALKQIMAVRANVVFPVLIPTLISVPISAFNARALASLVTVAGAALNRRLTTIMGALMESLNRTTDPDTSEQLRETTRALLLSIDNADGLHTLMAMLLEFVKSDDPIKRSGACDIVNTFYTESKLDASRYIGDWIRLLVTLLDDRQQIVVVAAWGALNATTKSVKKDDLEQLVGPVRRAVKSVGVAGVDLPGFCLPKGISPVLPIFLQGLMFGTTEVREQSALGIGDLIQRTSAEALKPFVTQITGPLIRIIGDRYPPQVKAAILQTLSLLLSKVPTHLKPFLPQLQRTFIKSLTDPSSAVVRSRAASALGILISLQTRVDPLVAELVSGIKTSEPGVKETMLNALESVVAKAGVGMGDPSKKGVLGVIVEGLSDDVNGE